MIRALDTKFLIEENGEELLLRKKSFSQYDPAEGKVTSSILEVYFIGYQASYDIQEIDGSTVIRGDRKVVMPPTDVNNFPLDPDIDDTIENSGDRVTIVSVSKIMSAGNILCYVCQVRK